MSPTEIAALTTAVALLVGALVAAAKRRPEMTQVIVKSAESLVITQSTVLRETRDAYEAVLLKMDQYEARATEHERLAHEQTTEIEKLHNELASMHEEMASLTHSRDQANEELASAKTEVDRLTARVQLLEDTLRAQDIPLPDGPPADA